MLKLDETDLGIIKELFKKKLTSTTSMAKKIYPNEINNLYDLKKKDMFIRSRLEKLNGIGLVEVSRDDGNALYFVNKKNCNLLRGKLFVIDGKNNFFVDDGRFLVYKIDKRACCVRC